MMQPALATQETEVVAMPKRRRFSAEEKLRILKEADACTQPGEQGALLRREGLYSSHLTEWRRARERGELDALAPKKRGRKPAAVNPLEKQVSELTRALQKAEARAKRAEALVELQKNSRSCWASSCRRRTSSHDGRHQAAWPRAGHRRDVRRPRRGARDVLPAAPATDARPCEEEVQPEGAVRRGEGRGAGSAG